jgi:aspartate oxidase
LEGSDEPTLILGRAVVLATGGIGGLYAHTTNPLNATGGGLALAARAGAVLRDLEFVQFHPTAMAVGLDPMPLATEALRGEGAVLVNSRGERFMQDVSGAELAPRDVVARAIFDQICADERVFLDTRAALGGHITRKFPGVTALCRATGLDPIRHPIPVRPAAHYHMGGISVDHQGRSSIEGLWACGEVASTGLHGANRLASNSLLEALAYAGWIADDIKGRALWSWTGQSPLPPPALQPRGSGNGPSQRLAWLRSRMDRQLGVLRDAAGLTAAICHLRDLVHEAHSTGEGNVALVSLMIAVSAYSRRESRGAHQRLDHPALNPEQHTEITLDQALRIAAEIDSETATPSRRVA